jgi:hypothetical protein
MQRVASPRLEPPVPASTDTVSVTGTVHTWPAESVVESQWRPEENYYQPRRSIKISTAFPFCIIPLSCSHPPTPLPYDSACPFSSVCEHGDPIAGLSRKGPFYETLQHICAPTTPSFWKRRAKGLRSQIPVIYLRVPHAHSHKPPKTPRPRCPSFRGVRARGRSSLYIASSLWLSVIPFVSYLIVAAIHVYLNH